jgi:class 3 adenylate cyclase
MGNRFDAKHAFAFGIDLEGQLAAVQLEDRQIIGRSLLQQCSRQPIIYSAACGSGSAALATERAERRLAAILAADIAGYSRLMGADEEGT